MQYLKSKKDLKSKTCTWLPLSVIHHKKMPHFNIKTTSRKELLKDMFIKYDITLEPIAVDVVESPGPAKKAKKDKTDTQSVANKIRLDLLMSFEAHDNTTDDGIDEEIENYLRHKVEPNMDCLDWWRAHYKLYPRLQQLARILFGIPATSASSETGFSRMSGFITATKSNMNPTKTNQLCFVSDNYEYISDSSFIKMPGF